MNKSNFISAVNLALLVLISGASLCLRDDTSRLVLKGHTKPVVDLQFTVDGKTLASMSADGETILWDLSAGNGRRVPALSRSIVAGSYLQFTRESPELLLAGSGGQGLLIDPTKDETIAEYGDRQQLNSGPIVYLGGRRALVGNSLVQEIGKAGNLFEVPNMTSSVVEAVSPDGNIWVTNRRFLAASNGSNRLELIDLLTGKANGELPKYAYIVGVSWVDNQHLLVLHAPGSLTLWETTPKVRLIAQQEIDGTSLTMSSTGKVAAVTVDKSKAEIFDITNDSIRLRRTVTAQSPIQLSADGGRLLSAGTAYQSYIVTDTSSGSVLLVNKQLEDDLFPEMTSDGRDVVVGHHDGTITFQPVGQPVATTLTLVTDLPLKMPPDTKAHPKFLHDNFFSFEDGEIVFSPKGDACVTIDPGSVRKSMTIADLKPGSSHFPVWYPYGIARQAKLESWAFTPESVLFVDYQPSGTPSETWFLSATVDFGSGRLVLNTAQGPRPLAILGFGINPDQKSIVALAGEYDRKHTGSSSIIQSADCVVLEYPSGKLVKTLAKDVDPISSPRIAFSSSGQRVAMLVKHKIRVWDIQSGVELILGEELNYGRFWLIDDGRTLVVPGTYGTMRGIDLETNEDAFVWSPEDKEAGEPSAIEFSHDGKYALCGSSIGEVTLRDSHTGAVLLRQAAFDGTIAAVGISRDSTQIAAANAERTLRVWKLGTIAQPETMATKSIEVTDVSAPDVLEMESGPSGESKLSANLHVEFTTDRAEFEKRFDQVKTIDFEDIETPDSNDAVVSFEANRYEKQGLIITGTEGQFAGRAFGYPDNFRPHSGRNMVAPGPQADGAAARGAGGHETKASFVVGDAIALSAGFGVHFIDCNGGESGMIAFDANGNELGRKLDLSGSVGKALFLGIVTYGKDGQPVPAISSIKLLNGSGWPAVYNNHGVVLDDILFSPPVEHTK